MLCLIEGEKRVMTGTKLTEENVNNDFLSSVAMTTHRRLIKQLIYQYR